MADLFILAGEFSGDRIGAALLEGLSARVDLTAAGVGGEAMRAKGLSSLFPMDDLAVMGFSDVARRLPLLLRRARQVVQAVIEAQPDCTVLIDAQVFSHSVARALRRRGFTKPILLYVAPTVWGWRPERARKIAPLYDEVLAVLPFEPQSMASLGGPETVYVGHPALDRFPLRMHQPKRGTVLLMPGSRVGELERHLPLMEAAAQALAGHAAVADFTIVSIAQNHAALEARVSRWPLPVRVVSAEEARRQALADAVLAFAVSGTATLELALAGVPHAVTYVADGLQAWLFRKALTRMIALPNIVAGREVVPELLFARRADPDRVAHSLAALLDSPSSRAAQVEDFKTIRAVMERGLPEAPRRDPVERVMAHIERARRGAPAQSTGGRP